MLVFNKKNILRGLLLTGLNLSIALVLGACFSDDGGTISKEDIGARNSVNENELSEQARAVLSQYREKIDIIKSSFPNDVSRSTEHVPIHCEDIDKSIISDDEDGDSTIDIYVGEAMTQKAQSDVISCGLERFQNKMQSSATTIDLMNKLASISERGRTIRQFYNENQENIQISLQGFNITEDGNSSVFLDHLKMRVDNDRYRIIIDSYIDEDIQAHLLAHALSIIRSEKEIDEHNIQIGQNFGFSVIQERLYYGDNNDSFLSNLNLTPEEQSIIEALYFYSRFHAYSTNQNLKEDGLEMTEDLTDQVKLAYVLIDLRRKNLITEATRASNGQNLVRLMENNDLESFIMFVSRSTEVETIAEDKTDADTTGTDNIDTDTTIPRNDFIHYYDINR